MIGGTIDSVLSSGNTVESGTSYTGGVVGVMEAATLINASSKNNVCIVNQVTCGGVVVIVHQMMVKSSMCTVMATQ